MRYLALCTDYDGTLATEGRVLPETISAVERLVASGRRVVLVTGRELDDLQSVCPRLDLFEYVVAENGALLYEPSSGKETALAERPPDTFVAALRARGVGRISVGRVIVATWEPHETAVLETIKEQGLELQVIFNKGAVMVLPAGVNKATGLTAALEKMRLSAHNTVGVGDAENDHALLNLCECGVAVANALPTLKVRADFVTTGDRGAGVAELIGEMLKDDLVSREPALARHHILLGRDSTDREIHVPPYGQNVLVAGTASSGKSTLAAGLLHRLSERGYTFCVLADGDYQSLSDAVTLGTAERPPTVEEIVKLFDNPRQSGVVDLSALPAAARPSFFDSLLPHLSRLRTQIGRPHWLVIDDSFASPGTSAASHGKSAAGMKAGGKLAPSVGTSPSVLWVTTRPGLIAAPTLATVELLVVTGEAPQATLAEFCELTDMPAPKMDPVGLESGEALLWRPRARDAAPFRLRVTPVTPVTRR